jgi:hypothetical protein
MNKETINITFSITLILTIGLLTGYTLGYYRANHNHFPEIQWMNDINPGIATIQLLEVKNGKLIGQISGRDGRIAYSSKDILTIKQGEKFEIPLHAIRLQDYYQASNIPTDAQFVASKQGKYYYSVLEKRAFSITEKNRIYFSNEKEAKNQGYLKKD